MTETRRGPAITGGIFLGPDRFAALDRALSRVIGLAFGGPGKAEVTPDDLILLDFTAQVHAAAAVSADRGGNMQVSAGADTSDVRTRGPVSSSGQELAALRTEDAAVVAGRSARTLRREIDRGVLKATQDPRGYLVDLQSLIAYVRTRRDKGKSSGRLRDGDRHEGC